EASLHFAKRMVEEGGQGVSDQIRYGYKLMMNKDIPVEKLDVLLKLYESIKGENSLIKKVVRRSAELQDEKHINAMSIMANTMLNLDEFIVKN
ncbi:MAG: hypothetical protein KAR17_13350, partial [Cyclobacteriaceae bacterium]|nr:hypothetical protein [Cyclobacteriaceae bacterium]